MKIKAVNEHAVYKLSRRAAKDIQRRFTYRPPRPDQVPRYQEIRDVAAAFAVLLVQFCPDNRERALALTHLEQVVMYGNAAIARGEG